MSADRDGAVHREVQVGGELDPDRRDEQMLAHGLRVGEDLTVEDLRVERLVGRTGAHRLTDELS